MIIAFRCFAILF